MPSRRAVAVGAAALALLLGVVVVGLARRPTSSLVQQADARLREAVDAGEELDERDGAPRRSIPSDLFVARVDAGGTVHTLVTPVAEPYVVPFPRIDVERVVAASADREPFTVESRTGNLRYRVLAVRQGVGEDVLVFVLPLMVGDGGSAFALAVLVAVIAAIGAGATAVVRQRSRRSEPMAMAA